MAIGLIEQNVKIGKYLLTSSSDEFPFTSVPQ